MSKKQNLFNYIIIAVLIIYNIVYKFIVLELFKNKEIIITSIFYILLFIVSVIMFGYSKSIQNTLKKRVNKTVTIIAIVGIILTYCVGVFVGFLKNGYSYAIINLIKNILPPTLIIVFTEMFRYNIIRSNKNKFKIIIIFTILITILEMQMKMAVVTNWSLKEVFIVTTTLAIPIIAKNMLLSYLNYEVGYQPCLIYRLILELYIYIVPYLPRFGDYLTSMFGLVLPMIAFIYSSENIDEYQGNSIPEFKEKRLNFIKVPIYIVIFTFILLISRVFPIFMIGVGSESMMGAINKGDAVIACKVKEENIQENDVIVFQTQDKILIHRVVEIENINGTMHYRTKGDANTSRDNIDVTIDKIYGKSYIKIPYIANLSVWLNEIMTR